MQRIGKIQRFRKCLGDGIQHHELAVAPADFQFRLLAFGDVLKESLVSSDVSAGVPHGDGGLQHGAHFAVFAPHFKFEVRHRAVLV